MQNPNPTILKTQKQNSATPSIKDRHVDLTHAPTVSTVKSSTFGSSAPNSPQMRNGYPKKMPTPVKPEILKTYLEGYEQDLANCLFSGFTYGFHLGCLNTPSSTPSKNHGSTNKHLEIVLNKIKKEQSYCRISKPKYPNLVISPLGVVPKNVQGQFRLIHDLSYPENNSVNS